MYDRGEKLREVVSNKMGAGFENKVRLLPAGTPIKFLKVDDIFLLGNSIYLVLFTVVETPGTVELRLSSIYAHDENILEFFNTRDFKFLDAQTPFSHTFRETILTEGVFRRLKRRE